MIKIIEYNDNDNKCNDKDYRVYKCDSDKYRVCKYDDKDYRVCKYRV